MCLFIDFSGFYLISPSTHTIHINCLNCISCTYFKLRYEQPLSTHTSAASPSAYIILSICERVFSITNVLATQSKCIHQEKNIVQSDALMSYAIMCPWPTGPRQSRTVYTNIYQCGCGWYSHGYPMQYKSYDIVWVVTTTLLKCSMQYGNLDEDE